MNAVDTNILVYSIDQSEPVKRAKARQLLQQLWSAHQSTVLFWQVAGELCNQLRRWRIVGRIRPAYVRRYLNVFRSGFALVMPGPDVLDLALDLGDQYSLSHWDSMLFGACLDAGIDTLYTEDMGSPTQYGGIQLLNPFI